MRTLLALWWVAAASCAVAAPAVSSTRVEARGAQLEARAWPEAQLFKPSGAWLGADGAYSIDLGAGRTLWLFGDTFIDPLADGSRSNGPNFFIRNSCAIQAAADAQHAYDPTRSTLSYHWGKGAEGMPGSFFPELDAGKTWLWPLHGVRMPDGKLLLFRMQLGVSQGGLGFAVNGWDAVAIDDPAQVPSAWQPRALAPLTTQLQKLVGSSVLIWGEHLYAYAVQNDPEDHSMYLARWPLAALGGLREGALADPAWWCGARGFAPAAQCPQPQALFADGQVELSVHYDARLQRFVEIQTSGVFLADAKTTLSLRTAPAPQGPWSALRPFYRPPEASRPDAQKLVVYAAKAHPEARWQAAASSVPGSELFVTYVVNDLAHPTPNDALYYPQALRVHVAAP